MTSFYEEIRKTDLISDENENAQSRKNIDKWIFRLLLCLLGVMPLLVIANVEEVISPLISNIDLLSSGIKGELFTHYKSLITLVITIIIALMLLVKIFFMGGEIRKTIINYFLGIFVISILISTIMSPNITIALNGQYNRSDGALSWLCYIILLFVALNIEYPKNTHRYIMYTMIPFVYINLYIITMNFYGKDLMQQAGVQKFVSLVLPEGTSISEGSTLVGTLNQWNYMSGMFAIMVVMYLAWALTAQKNIEIILGIITALASIAVMFMSISTSGFITIIISLFFVIVVLFKQKSRKKSILIFSTFIILTIPIFHVLAEKDVRVWEESFGFLIPKNPYVKEDLSLSFNENRVYASDEEFQLPALPAKGNSAGSGRIYIWDKMAALIKERVFVGYGADTLMYNFPHYNIDARAGIKSEHTITDKAHNQYIGALYGFGLLGALALVALAFSALVVTIKSISKKHWSLFVLGLASLAYFIQALFNDSLPGVTPVAFVLLGTALNISSLKKESIINE